MEKSLIKITALFIICALSFGVAFAFTACSTPNTAIVIDEKGNEINAGKITSLPRGIVYTADAVTSASEPITRTFRATIKPDNATNKNLNWSITWANPSNEWAADKGISEYLSITASGNTATLHCYQAFGAQAVLTVRSEDNPDIFKTCTIDYQSKIIDHKLELYQDGTLLDVLDSYSELIGLAPNEEESYYNKEAGILKHKHSLKLSIGYILDTKHSISFRLKPIFSVGSIGNGEIILTFSALAGVNIRFVRETIYRFMEHKAPHNTTVYTNLSNNHINPDYINTKENPFDPYAKHSITLGTIDIRNLFFFNGFIASDSQVRDVVNFAAKNNLCLFQLSYGIFNVNNSLQTSVFCFGCDNSTLGVSVSDVTLDNTEIVI